MLYFLVMAMYPVRQIAASLLRDLIAPFAIEQRFLITFDEEGEQIPISVRVGQAVDVIGQAGKPRTISGFQTHQTPVRLGQTERAELATEEYWVSSTFCFDRTLCSSLLGLLACPGRLCSG